MEELVVVDKTVAPGDFLDAAGFDFLPFFDNEDEEKLMGLSQTGSSCLLTARVIGWRRVPEPPARMMPFMGGSPLRGEELEARS